MTRPLFELPTVLAKLLLVFVAVACTREAQEGRRDTGGEPDVAAVEAADVPPDPGAGDEVVAPDGAEVIEPVDAAPEAVSPAPIEFLAEASFDDKTTLKAMFDVIDGATTTLDVAHFEANDDDPIVDALLNSLKKAKARGVTVRAMFDDDVEGNELAVDLLVAAGIDARLDNANRRLHVKLLVADGAVALFGSTNWSETSLKYSHETNVLVRDALVGAKIGEFFEALWQAPGTLKELPRVTTPHVTVAFERDLYDLLRERIRSASERVLLVYYDISVATSEIRAVTADLVDAKARGAEVTVILEYNDWDEIVNDINAEAAAWLQQRGVTVLADPIDEQTHAKLAICDDVVLVGTANLSYTSLFDDHELGASSADPQVLADALAWFQAMKAMSAAYPK